MNDAPNSATNTPGFFPAPGGDQTTPRIGLDSLAQPQDQDESLPLTPPGVGGGATIFQRLSASNSPHLKTLYGSTTNALKANPQAASQPGGWARALVGGAIDALGGDLGDAAAATAPVPPGGGFLTGVARTLAAGRQRQTAEKQQQFQNRQEADKNAALNAEANARKVYQQQLTHRLGDEAVQASVASGKEQIAALKNQANPGIEREKGLTADQAHEILKKDGLDPKEETMVPSGSLMTTDKDGQPYSQATYSIMRLTPADLDPKDPDHKKVLDRLNKWIPPEEKKKWQGEKDGTIHFSGSQFNMLLTMAGERETADIATRKAAVQAGMADQDLKDDEEALKFRNDPVVQRALAQAGTVNGAPDFISARNALVQASQNPKSPLYNQYNNVDNDMRHFLKYTENSKGDRTYVYDKLLEDYQKKQDTAMEFYTNFLKEADTADGEKAASMASAADTKSKDPTVPPGLRAVYGRKAVQLKKQAQASIDHDAEKKSAETVASQGDPTSIAPQIVDPGGNLDPSQLSKRASTFNAQMKAIDDYAKQKYGNQPSPDGYYDGNHFNIAKATTDYKYANRGDTQNTLKYLNSLTGGIDGSKSNMAELVNRSNSITRTDFPAINDAAAWARLQLGDPKMAAYYTTVLEVSDQVAKILQGGGTGNGTSDAKLQQAQELFNKGFSKDSINAVVGALQPLLANRRDSIIGDNRYLIKQFGKVPKNAANPKPGRAVGDTPVWKMNDGTIQDSIGRKYDPKTGQLLQG